MKRRYRGIIRALALIAIATPMVTVATCDRTGPSSGVFNLRSTNDDLVDDVLELFDFDDDD